MATPRKTAPYVTTREKLDADQVAAIEAMKRINADAAAKAREITVSTREETRQSAPLRSYTEEEQRRLQEYDTRKQQAIAATHDDATNPPPSYPPSLRPYTEEEQRRLREYDDHKQEAIDAAADDAAMYAPSLRPYTEEEQRRLREYDDAQFTVKREKPPANTLAR